MPSSNFKLFDENKQNILTTEEYNGSTARLNGVQAGIASSKLHNKSMYQQSLMSYALAQLMVENGIDASDEAAVSTFVSNLGNTLLQKIVDKATPEQAADLLNNTKYLTPAMAAHTIPHVSFTKQQTLTDATAQEIWGTLPYTGKLSEAPVGTIVNLIHNGVLTPHIVVHQGNPDSSMYDSSCDGTWLLRKGMPNITMYWNSTGTNTYDNSDVNTYLNGTYYDFFGDMEKGIIKQVKIPYGVGGGSSDVNSGANGLSVKSFLLCNREVGFDSSSLISDGAKLDYFESGIGTSANNVRIATAEGGTSANYWWTRTPFSTGSAIIVSYSGSSANVVVNSTSYMQYTYRPCIIVNSDGLFVNADGTLATTDTEFPVPDDAFSKIASLFNGVSSLLGLKLSFEMGKYTGTDSASVSIPQSSGFNYQYIDRYLPPVLKKKPIVFSIYMSVRHAQTAYFQNYSFPIGGFWSSQGPIGSNGGYYNPTTNTTIIGDSLRTGAPSQYADNQGSFLGLYNAGTNAMLRSYYNKSSRQIVQRMYNTNTSAAGTAQSKMYLNSSDDDYYYIALYDENSVD